MSRTQAPREQPPAIGEKIFPLTISDILVDLRKTIEEKKISPQTAAIFIGDHGGSEGLAQRRIPSEFFKQQEDPAAYSADTNNPLIRTL